MRIQNNTLLKLFSASVGKCCRNARRASTHFAKWCKKGGAEEDLPLSPNSRSSMTRVLSAPSDFLLNRPDISIFSTLFFNHWTVNLFLGSQMTMHGISRASPILPIMSFGPTSIVVVETTFRLPLEGEEQTV